MLQQNFQTDEKEDRAAEPFRFALQLGAEKAPDDHSDQGKQKSGTADNGRAGRGGGQDFGGNPTAHLSCGALRGRAGRFFGKVGAEIGAGLPDAQRPLLYYRKLLRLVGKGESRLRLAAFGFRFDLPSSADARDSCRGGVPRVQYTEGRQIS